MLAAFILVNGVYLQIFKTDLFLLLLLLLKVYFLKLNFYWSIVVLQNVVLVLLHSKVNQLHVMILYAEELMVWILCKLVDYQIDTLYFSFPWKKWNSNLAKFVIAWHVKQLSVLYSVKYIFYWWYWLNWCTYLWKFSSANGKEPACQCKRHERYRFCPGSGQSPGGGHGNPLQCSGLGNPMSRGAWRATVHRIAKSWTHLKQVSTTHHQT